MHIKLQKSLFILIGLFLTAIGIKLLNIHTLTFGGTAGIATLVSFMTNWTWGILFLIVNLPFFILSIKKLGWNFSLLTFLCIILISAISDLMDYLMLPLITPIAAAIVAGSLIGIGVSFVLNSGASLGGIHILALYLEQKSNINRGISLFVTDFIIVSSAVVMFGFKNALISIIAITVASFLTGRLKSTIKPSEVEYQPSDSESLQNS
ncbi:YitT family protein [Fictibacillus norfolkensis]|uniref:YitT family protein n=1 Tax=Fictibacillus norfolkensis TaxID=2762233 RepID=A0ABR8SL67_9BACL|nr:YitT family protein [Fictibacillus norfolkensis]MBD7964200.1 YitT family protein [Fictibacillus norfolkensis]